VLHARPLLWLFFLDQATFCLHLTGGVLSTCGVVAVDGGGGGDRLTPLGSVPPVVQQQGVQMSERSVKVVAL
jgi:hypothetical protein